MKMSKFFKILINSFFVIIMIASLLSIIFVFVSWNDKIDEVVINIDEIVINNSILSKAEITRAEITFLDSEEKLPPESSLEKKAKLFIIPWRDVLKFCFFYPEISEYYLKQEMKIRPIKNLRHERLRLFAGAPNFYIKDISLKGNLLEIELGLRKFADIPGIVTPVTIIAIFFFILKISDQEKKIEVIETVLKQKS